MTYAKTKWNIKYAAAWEGALVDSPRGVDGVDLRVAVSFDWDGKSGELAFLLVGDLCCWCRYTDSESIGELREGEGR